MTQDELNLLKPEDVDRMTDEELAAALAPLIPIVRAPFAGRAESSIILAPDKRKSKKHMADMTKMLLTYMEKTNHLNKENNDDEPTTS